MKKNSGGEGGVGCTCEFQIVIEGSKIERVRKDMKHEEKLGRGEGSTCGFPIVVREIEDRKEAPLRHETCHK